MADLKLLYDKMNVVAIRCSRRNLFGVFSELVPPSLDHPLGPVSLKGLSFGRKLVRLTHLVPEDTTA